MVTDNSTDKKYLNYNPFAQKLKTTQDLKNLQLNTKHFYQSIHISLYFRVNTILFYRF